MTVKVKRIARRWLEGGIPYFDAQGIKSVVQLYDDVEYLVNRSLDLMEENTKLKKELKRRAPWKM